MQNRVKVALRSGQTTSDLPVQPIKAGADSSAPQAADDITIQKGDEPATQTVEQPNVVESAEDSTIKEEELPPE